MRGALFAIRCLLIDDCCLRFASLFAVCRLLSVVCCELFCGSLVAACCSVFAARCVVRSLLLDVCCLLFDVWCVVFVVC